MVKAGNPVDMVIEQLASLLDEGDMILDGGNSYFEDTRRREKSLKAQGIYYFGTGVSGGEHGARFGPSIMPGGDESAYRHIAPVLEAIAAKAKGEPCCAYMGPDGAGHYVKMVHNGIEYADMQLIAEAYLLLKYAGGYTNEELADIFEAWNEGELKSYLIEITARILREADDYAQGELLDQATQYLVTYALCSPVTTIVFAVDNYLRICGKIRRSMFLNIFMSVACMGFELLFMGVLKIGIRGAALGSSLGMALTAIAAFVPFFFGKMQLRFVRPRFHAKALRDCLLRAAQLFEQHCRARHLHHYERGAAGPWRAERRVRLRHFDDHGRLCPPPAVRHVRFPPARGGL